MRTVDIDGHEWRVLCQEFVYGDKHGVAIATEIDGKKLRYAVLVDATNEEEEEAVQAALPALIQWARDPRAVDVRPVL